MSSPRQREHLSRSRPSSFPIPVPVKRWQEGVAGVGPFDLEVDTSVLDPAACADVIAKRLRDGPAGKAFAELARP